MPDLEFLLEEDRGWASVRDDSNLGKFVYIEGGTQKHIVEIGYKERDNSILFVAGESSFVITADSKQTECTAVSPALPEFKRHILIDEPKPQEESLKELSDYLTSLVKTGPPEDARININEKIDTYCKSPWHITESLFMGANPKSRWSEVELIKENYPNQTITLQYLPQKKQYLISIRFGGPAENVYMLIDEHSSLAALRGNQEEFYETLKPEEKSDICTRIDRRQDLANEDFYESFSNLMNSLMTMDRASFIKKFSDYNLVEIPSSQAGILRGVISIEKKRD